MELWDTSFHLITAIENDQNMIKEFKSDCQKYDIPNLEIDENTVYDADAFAEQILTESHKW